MQISNRLRDGVQNARVLVVGDDEPARRLERLHAAQGIEIKLQRDPKLYTCATVLFSDYGKGGLAHILRMIEAARSAGKSVLIDPKGSDYRRYKGATVITPNRAELAQIIGGWSDEAHLTEKAQALRESLNVDNLVLTRSEEGMTLYDVAGQLHVAAQALEVFDVTGAGDTVIATLSTLMAAALTAREALPLANRAGGLVVGKFGTASITYDELFAESSA